MKPGSRLPILRSPQQERILAELFVFAQEPISLSELARRADTSIAGAHNEVERLEASGLVRSRTVGRNRMIVADETSPLYPELRGLLLKTVGPEPLLRSALGGIEGVHKAIIFGSWADPSELSPADIDVLVIGDPEVGEVYDAVSTVESEVGRPVNVTIRSLTEWEGGRDHALVKSVRRGPTIELI